jgi:hypothetical protein
MHGPEIVPEFHRSPAARRDSPETTSRRHGTGRIVEAWMYLNFASVGVDRDRR